MVDLENIKIGLTPITEIITKYKRWCYRDDKKVKNLCIVDFSALIWNLKTGIYVSNGYQTRHFLSYALNGSDTALFIINDISPLRSIIEKELFSE